MSYEKVKSICIDEKNLKVYINRASNNCRPLSYTREEYPYFSNILKNEGKEEVEIELLRGYESGNLQNGTNKYTNALQVLRYVFKDEYFKFNWRNFNAKYGTPERQAEEDLRKSDEFKELLRKCLNYKLPKNKWIIYKESYNGRVYGKRCPTCMKWLWDWKKATKFDFEEEAKDNIFLKYKDEW
jgi:hypothetical protein